MRFQRFFPLKDLFTAVKKDFKFKALCETAIFYLHLSQWDIENSMVERVKKFIQNLQLLPENGKVVAGVSGGIDSMVMAHLLINLGYSCVVAHSNFHLRGAESDRDESFVKRWCKERDVTFVSIDFNTKEYAAEKKISIEMAARELRYNWFSQLCVLYEADAVAVAHHKDDSVETVLLNLIRGTGIRGLRGILAKNGNIVRPLLSVTRNEIEQFGLKHNIPYVVDSTNREEIYIRNILRLNIIPKMEEINPAVSESIYRTSQHIYEAEKIYRRSIEESLAKVLSNNKIDISAIKESASPRSMLFEILSPLGFEPSVIEDVFQSIDATPGKLFYSKTERLIKDRNYFLIDPISDTGEELKSYFIDSADEEVGSPIKMHIRKEKTPVVINRDQRFLYLDSKKLTFPLELRKWRRGDWFIPFGMKGRKKLSDFFTDLKYSLKDKEDVWLLLSGEDIVWVVGKRSDDRFKLTEKSDEAVIIELIDKAAN